MGFGGFVETFGYCGFQSFGVFVHFNFSFLGTFYEFLFKITVGIPQIFYSTIFATWRNYLNCISINLSRFWYICYLCWSVCEKVLFIHWKKFIQDYSFWSMQEIVRDFLNNTREKNGINEQLRFVFKIESKMEIVHFMNNVF